PGRWREAATCVLHGLEEDGRDGVGAFELDGFGDTVGAVLTERLDVVRIWLWRAVKVGVRGAETTRCQRFELRLEGRQSGDRQCTLRRAVVSDGPRNHLVLTGFPGQLEVVL